MEKIDDKLNSVSRTIQSDEIEKLKINSIHYLTSSRKTILKNSSKKKSQVTPTQERHSTMIQRKID